jgi:tetratricopeptide (TPR) repeat protein
MVLSWLKAAGEIALPTVFVVDRSGKIAWIGDTLAVEKPLEQIVAGTWNLDLARAEHHKRVKINALRRTLNEQIRADQWELQLATIEAMRQLSPESEVLTASWRFRALLSLGREPEAYAYGRRVTKELLWEQPLDLNVMAWAIVDPEAARRAVRDLEFALLLAERAVALTESKHSAVLDTLALVHFERGNLTLALELQEQAVKLAENSMYYSDLVKRLEQFREAKRARDSKRAEDGGRLVKG